MPIVRPPTPSDLISFTDLQAHLAWMAALTIPVSNVCEEVTVNGDIEEQPINDPDYQPPGVPARFTATYCNAARHGVAAIVAELGAGGFEAFVRFYCDLFPASAATGAEAIAIAEAHVDSLPVIGAVCDTALARPPQK